MLGQATTLLKYAYRQQLEQYSYYTLRAALSKDFLLCYVNSSIYAPEYLFRVESRWIVANRFPEAPWEPTHHSRAAPNTSCTNRNEHSTS